MNTESKELLNESNIYYNGAELLSYNRLLSFCMGSRGYGKTFFFKDYCIRDFIKNGFQFVWVRRYKPEVKLMKTFFDDIMYKFPSHTFKIDGNKAYIDNKLAGWFIPLVISHQYKSVPFPNVNKIIFDEFVITTRHDQYLENEPVKFLDLYSTVARLRENVRAIFIANSATISNPYFNYFKISPIKGKRFTKNKNIVIEHDTDIKFIDKASSTRFGQLIKGTTYGNYALENEYLLDNYVNVERRSPDSIYKITLAHSGQYYGIYFDYNRNLIYVARRKNLNGGYAIAITSDDVEENTFLAKSENVKEVIKTIKEMFAIGKCRFDDIKIKSGFYDIMRILNMR